MARPVGLDGFEVAPRRRSARAGDADRCDARHAPSAAVVHVGGYGDVSDGWWTKTEGALEIANEVDPFLRGT